MKLVDAIKQLEDLLGRFGNLELHISTSEDGMHPITGFTTAYEPFEGYKIVEATHDGW